MVGVGIHLNATDRSELEFEQILPSVKRFTWRRGRREGGREG